MTQKPEELTQVIVTVMEVYREEGTAGRMGDIIHVSQGR